MNLLRLRQLKEPIYKIAEAKGASNIRVFGSTAKGQDLEDSDIDLLITIKKDRSYFDFVALWQELEELLDCKVDLLTDDGISPYMVDAIIKEAVPL